MPTKKEATAIAAGGSAALLIAGAAGLLTGPLALGGIAALVAARMVRANRDEAREINFEKKEQFMDYPLIKMENDSFELDPFPIYKPRFNSSMRNLLSNITDTFSEAKIQDTSIRSLASSPVVIEKLRLDPSIRRLTHISETEKQEPGLFGMRTVSKTIRRNTLIFD